MPTTEASPVLRLSELSPARLLALHAGVTEELRDRGVVRSSNNTTGDFAELLFCRAFDWEQADNSVKSYDAVDAAGLRYQIKCRRFTKHNRSRQLSALRDLPAQGFDLLAGALLNTDYTVLRAALVPHQLVLDNSIYGEHANAWRFHLTEAVWDWAGVKDVTDKLRAVVL